MNILYVESLNLKEKSKVSNYIKAHKEVLNTFLELSCPVCKEELTDGAEVVRLDCSHIYHIDCFKEELASVSEEQSRDTKIGSFVRYKEYTWVECGEEIMIGENFNASIY
jgi:non-homologous end joining protein Ku